MKTSIFVNGSAHGAINELGEFDLLNAFASKAITGTITQNNNEGSCVFQTIPNQPTPLITIKNLARVKLLHLVSLY